LRDIRPETPNQDAPLWLRKTESDRDSVES
jgi:hypothetical protein